MVVRSGTGENGLGVRPNAGERFRDPPGHVADEVAGWARGDRAIELEDRPREGLRAEAVAHRVPQRDDREIRWECAQEGPEGAGGQAPRPELDGYVRSRELDDLRRVLR